MRDARRRYATSSSWCAPDALSELVRNEGMANLYVLEEQAAREKGVVQKASCKNEVHVCLDHRACIVEFVDAKRHVCQWWATGVRICWRGLPCSGPCPASRAGRSCPVPVQVGRVPCQYLAHLGAS
jgi:hypothetical protein